MKRKEFTLDMVADGQEIGAAAFSALLAAAWTLYSSTLIGYAAAGRDPRQLDDQTKVDLARQAFAYVADLVAPGPYRRELDRYVRDVLPGKVASVPPFLIN